MEKEYKDFEQWNVRKQQLDGDIEPILFKEGEIWWCSIGVNIGDEVLGKGKDFRRPVIIFKKLSATACIAIPLTTKSFVGRWYYHIYIGDRDQWIMMNQMRSISANRLSVRAWTATSDQFLALKKSVATLLGLL